MSETVKTSMSKPKKIVVWLIVAVWCATIAIFVILACIPVRGFNREEVTDYLYVNVYDAQSGTSPLVSIQNNGASGLSDEHRQIADLLNTGLKQSQYTAFRAAFEFSYLGNLRLHTETKSEKQPVWDEDTGFQQKDKDGELVFETVETVYHTEVAASEIVTKTAPASDRITLEFVYAEQRTPDADGNLAPAKTVTVTDKDGKKATIGYDTMRVAIFDSNNTISEFAMYFYDRAALFADNAEVVGATIPVVLVRANTTTLYENLVDIAELVRTGKISE